MKTLRRFQRTFFTLLVGANIFVFSASFHKDLGTSLSLSLCSMCAVAFLLLSINMIARYTAHKKKSISITSSKQN